MDKPKVKLNDGNAFSILGACKRAGVKAKWPEEKYKEFREKATSGDYNNLLMVVCQHFDVQ